MSGTVEDRLKSLNIELPVPTTPVANYVPFVHSGSQVFFAGQIPIGPDGSLMVGKVGDDVSIDDAIAAARLCGLNLIAQVRAACDGDLDRVVRCLRLTGFVNCIDGADFQPQVINGVSDLMVEVFGEAGRHSRSAVGVNALPRNVPVEVDGIFEIS